MFRLALAAVISLVVALLAAGGTHGPAASFVFALPALVLGVGLISHAVEARLGPHMTESLLACAFVVPSFNAWYSAVLDRVFLLPYLPPDRGLLEAIQGAAFVCRCSAPPLFGAAMALLVLRGWRALGLGILILAGASGARAARLVLEHGAGALRVGDLGEATSHLLLAEGLASLLVIAPVGVGLLRAAERPVRLAVLLLGVMVAISGSAPVVQFIRLLTPAEANTVVPVGPPGLSWTLPTLAGDRGDLAPGLRRQGHPKVPKRRWVCHDVEVGRFSTLVRGTVGLALAPEGEASRLVDLLPTLYTHGVDRVAIVGRSAPTVGFLDPWMGWPAAPILLDLPKEGRWMSVVDGRVEPLEPGEGSGICYLKLDEGLTVQELYGAVRTMVAAGGDCPNGVVLPPPGTTPETIAEACP